MSTRFQMAQGLVDRANQRWLEQTGAEFEACQQGVVTIALQIATKEVIDLLRSSLDFCATEVYEKCHGTPPEEKQRVYFPIAKPGEERAEFTKRVNRKHMFHGLDEKRPDVMRLFESFQEFSSPANVWLWELRELSDHNKHKELSIQLAVDTEIIAMAPVMGRAVYGISVPKGVPKWLSGFPVDGRLPRAIGERRAGRYFWFPAINKATQQFLLSAVRGVDFIVKELTAKTCVRSKDESMGIERG